MKFVLSLSIGDPPSPCHTYKISLSGVGLCLAVVLFWRSVSLRTCHQPFPNNAERFLETLPDWVARCDIKAATNVDRKMSQSRKLISSSPIALSSSRHLNSLLHTFVIFLTCNIFRKCVIGSRSKQAHQWVAVASTESPLENGIEKHGSIHCSYMQSLAPPMSEFKSPRTLASSCGLR